MFIIKEFPPTMKSLNFQIFAYDFITVSSPQNKDILYLRKKKML